MTAIAPGAIVALSGNPDAPRQMPYCSDTVTVVEAKNALVAKEFAACHAVSVSTGFTETSSAA